MKLITETDFRDFDIIKESGTNGRPKSVKLRGIYIQADKRNGNDRYYDFDMMKKEVDRFRDEFIKTGRALGELEHPDRVEIDPSNAAVRIISLEENTDDKNWTGESIVLASDPEYGIRGTPKGDIALSLIQYGTKLGFSTRGCGEISESTNEVTDYHLCTIDLVTNPSIGMFCDSNGNRCVNGILESKEFILNNHGILVEKAYDKLEKTISKLPKKQSLKDEKLSKAVYDFFRNISNL